VSRRSRTLIVAALTVVGLVLGAAAADAGNTYSDPEYLQHDLDNVSRSLLGRQTQSLVDLQYAYALFGSAAPQSELQNLARQLRDLPQGRLYATVGQIPGGSVGDPIHFHDQTPVEVGYLSRTGAKVVGHLWSDGKAGPHPGVVITPGSLQGMQQAYWWAARALSDAGYVVLTFDAQGQGQAETFGHAPGDPSPNGDGFPFQQAPNFIDGTVDALRYLLSSTTAPYAPGGWSAADVAKAKAQDRTISWANPIAARVDGTRVALAGHSLGAHAVSVVQQCSDLGQLWRTLAVCGGRSFPIKAVVAWDSLSPDVVPVVPAMDQRADGYFINPAPTNPAPNPKAHLDSLTRWRKAGLDAYALTIRGGTHLEWTDLPYVLPSTTYGILAAQHYTVAWIDRYLSTDSGVRDAASEALADGPRVDRTTHGRDQLPWSASFLSARFLGGFTFHDSRGGTRVVDDLRAYGGRSKVGDWHGANADQPKVRPTPGSR
jgi:dienelactone hydrolase